MDEKEIVNLLRHYRHDWSNDLQVIMGYAQMGKLDKVQQKSAEVAERLMREQQFQNMDLPATILKLMRLNNLETGIRWEPVIEIVEPPIINDHQLAHLVESVHQIISKYLMNSMLYHGTIKFQQFKKQPFRLILEINQALKDLTVLIDELTATDYRIQIVSAQEERLVVVWEAD
ncbi:Spo0B domain-containing protein [Amphibacillus jilinensis]|uniref:Spo0B domain-containing protein n=1 Tax=Amphibacillus jilinensis TaxID=1216008 RepID=UPI0003005FB6|nr:Spo0B domain-containing protein [Amphibacillus jilinensis]